MSSEPTAAKPKEKTSKIQLQRIDNLLDELGHQVKNPQVIKYRLSTIIKSLESLISGNKACMTIQDEKPMKLNPTERIAGNANNILQPRFHKTEKKRRRPRKIPLKRPTEEDMKKLLRNEGETLATQTEEAAAGPSHGSAAPYPSLRLVHPQGQPLQVSRSDEQNVFSIGQYGLGQPSWMRIPPSMLGKRITVIKDGKPQQIIFSTNGT